MPVDNVMSKDLITIDEDASIMRASKLMKQNEIQHLGAGASGIGVAKGLIAAGHNNIVLCDRHGALHVYRLAGMNWAKSEIARLVGPQDVKLIFDSCQKIVCE